MAVKTKGRETAQRDTVQVTAPSFASCYILFEELERFGLPGPDAQPDIMNGIRMASAIIDEACGRVDGDGNGSMVYTTYAQRLLLTTRNRNLIEVPIKPIVPVSAAMVAQLQAAIPGGGSNYDDSDGNFSYTGVQANTVISGFTGSLGGFLSASGRYGYTRQDNAIAYPDLFAMINPLNLITMFGGPAPWVPIDISALDYDSKTGEAWLPAGLQLQKYSEVLIRYNSGWNPFQMPWAIKFATASLLKNALAKGNWTTGLLNLNVRGSANYGMQQALIDLNIDQLLTPYKVVRGY